MEGFSCGGGWGTVNESEFEKHFIFGIIQLTLTIFYTFNFFLDGGASTWRLHYSGGSSMWKV